jgi:hypothetical protein
VGDAAISCSLSSVNPSGFTAFIFPVEMVEDDLNRFLLIRLGCGSIHPLIAIQTVVLSSSNSHSFFLFTTILLIWSWICLRRFDTQFAGVD